MPVQARPQSGMLTSMLAAFPKPWPRRSWSSFSRNMVVSSPHESWLIKSQVKCFSVISFLEYQGPVTHRSRLVVAEGGGYGPQIGRFLTWEKDFLSVNCPSLKWAILRSQSSPPWELLQQQTNYLSGLQQRIWGSAWEWDYMTFKVSFSLQPVTSFFYVKT